MSRRRPRAALALGATAVVAIGAVAAVVATRSDDGRGGGSCLGEVVAHLPADVTGLEGADLAQARDAGYDDGDLDGVRTGIVEVGLVPDPVTQQSVQFLSDDAPFDPSNVRCWAGRLGLFVARGSFDAGRVRAAPDVYGDLATEGDLLAGSSGDDASAEQVDPSDLLEGGDPSPVLVAAVEALDEEGVASFVLVSSEDADETDGGTGGPAAGPWSGLALAPGDDWDLVAVWSFADAGAADEGEAAIREALADGSDLPGLVEGDPADGLARDGTVIVLRAPLAGDPTAWAEPLHRNDPALFPWF